MPDDLHARLQQQFPTAKPATLRQMLRDGRVRVNGTVARRLTDPVKPSDEVDVGDTPRVANKPQFRPMLQPMTLVLDDADFLVVDKPAGLLSSTVPNEKRPTAWAKVRRHLEANEPRGVPGLVHRLDRDASGLLVFSKTPQAYDSLKEQFFRHTVERVYVAVTHGVPTPAEGRITSMLIELPDGKVRTSRKPGVGRQAITDYRTIDRGGGLAGVRGAAGDGPQAPDPRPPERAAGADRRRPRVRPTRRRPAADAGGRAAGVHPPADGPAGAGRDPRAERVPARGRVNRRG